MDPSTARVLGAIVFFVVIFVSGFVLLATGKPYSVLVLTLHKLVAVAAVILLGISLYQTADLGAVEYIALAVTGALFIGAVATGGMLASENSMPLTVKSAHFVLPFLTVISTVVMLFLVNRN